MTVMAIIIVSSVSNSHNHSSQNYLKARKFRWTKVKFG